MLSFVFIYRAVAWAHEFEWTNSATVWTECLLVGQFQGQVCNPEIPPDHPDKGLWFLLHFTLSAQGLVNFCIYGFMMENVTLWLNKFGEWFGIESCQRIGTKGPTSKSEKSGEGDDENSGAESTPDRKGRSPKLELTNTDSPTNQE